MVFTIHFKNTYSSYFIIETGACIFIFKPEVRVNKAIVTPLPSSMAALGSKANEVRWSSWREKKRVHVPPCSRLLYHMHYMRASLLPASLLPVILLYALRVPPYGV